MIIIGITGTLGAGKGTIADFLVRKNGFKHFSVGGYLTKRLIRKGVKVDRDAMAKLGNELRTKFGSSYLALELYKEANKTGQKAIIESLRTPAEIEALKKAGTFYLFAVYADQKIRYKRIVARASKKDKVSFREFKSGEEKEIKNTNPNMQNLEKCILMADYKFDNNGTIKDLYEKVEKVIAKIT